jgi:hypothetical protein
VLIKSEATGKTKQTHTCDDNEGTRLYYNDLLVQHDSQDAMRREKIYKTYIDVGQRNILTINN